MENLPFFVYGTLRPGQSNYSYALEGNTFREEKAILSQAQMYGRFGFPYIIDGAEGELVIGDLVWVKPEYYSQVAYKLDMIEGYRQGYSDNNLYNRMKRVVQVNDKNIDAWVYIASNNSRDRFLESGLPRIYSGDWLLNLEENGRYEQIV